MLDNTSSKRWRILVVDDNRDAAQGLATLLTSHNQVVQQAYDGATAVETAQYFQPEIVFLDLMMPNMDGFAVAQKLRELEQMTTTRAVIVALTACEDPPFREATAEADFDLHLNKPASAREVMQVVTTTHPA